MMMLLMPRRVGLLALTAAVLFFAVAPLRAEAGAYFPPKGEWARRAPAELGMDPVRLAEAIAFAQSRESTRAFDFSDQERIFGSLLGSVPTRRAATNGVVIYKGYVVAEFGETTAVDPTYSAAKSMIATVAGVAVRDGLLAVEDRVGALVRDGGYDSPQNREVTWRMHLQQESEWEGEMFGKKRVRKAVEANASRGPDEVIQVLMDEFGRHNAGKALDDDVTIAAVRIK